MEATRRTGIGAVWAEDATPTFEPVRIGLIGTGFGATVHLPALAYLPETEVVAVCSRRADRALAVALDHGIPNHLTDYRELVRDAGVEAVVVASPPHLHHAMSLAALEAGKHVLCEKPMARNLAEARDMVKIGNRVGVVAMVNHQLRYLPIRARIKELIDEDYLGEPHAATVTVHRSSLNDPFDRPFGWLMEQEKAGGMLGATGSQHVDALRWWFGEVKAVAGATATMVKRRRLPESSAMATVDADDNFAVLLKFANGALGTIHVTATAAFEGDEEITLSGSRGTLRVRDGRLWGARTGDAALAEQSIPERLEGDLPRFDHFLTRPTALLARAWVRAIRLGEPAAPTFADGVKVQELLDAVGRSSAQGRWIDTSGTRWPMGAAVRP
jgi:predicted dehydrogenase